MTDSRRGFVPSDEKEFSVESVKILRRAQKDILYLMNQGYPIKNASTFVGNHYMLSERQRLAIVRASSSGEELVLRKGKELTSDTLGTSVVIDGLNTIITLEVALSQGILIRCMDGCIRDLAGLRGTYRLIHQTDLAIQLLGEKLSQLKVEEIIFYLDSPVSNTGRLKSRIFELLGAYPFRLQVEVVHDVDVRLQQMEGVISSDSIILNKCKSWFNIVNIIMEDLSMELIELALSNSAN